MSGNWGFLLIVVISFGRLGLEGLVISGIEGGCYFVELLFYPVRIEAPLCLPKKHSCRKLQLSCLFTIYAYY